MKKVLYIVLFLIVTDVSYANDDLFVDDTVEEIPFEFDPNFKDDFIDIEQVNDMAPNNIIKESYDFFSSTNLLRRENSLSVFGGNETIASTYHLTIYPQARFSFWQVFGYLGLPLRFPMYDNVSRSSVGLRSRGLVAANKMFLPRSEDFRSWLDAQRIIRHFELGNQSYFLRLSRINSITLSHGELVRNMSPEGLHDLDTLFLSSFVSLDQFRAEAFLAPIFSAEMFGISTRFLPFNRLDESDLVRSLNFDLTYVNDFMAPNLVQREGIHFVLQEDRRLIKRKKGTAQGLTMGFACEFLPISFLSLKPYLSSGHLLLTGLKDNANASSLNYGAGLHLGHDATIYFRPGTKKSILLLKTEGRLFSQGYWPSYFGSSYLIDRVLLNDPGKTLKESPITKSQYLNSSPPGFRLGYLVELAYAYDNFITAQVGYESAHAFSGVNLPALRRLHLAASLLGFDLIKFYLAYQATSIAQISELFDSKNNRGLLSLTGQLKLMEFLYFDTWAKHSFGINDMFMSSGRESDLWLSKLTETKSLNFGLGLLFTMTL